MNIRTIAFASALMLGGCFDAQQYVSVNEDGSIAVAVTAQTPRKFWDMMPAAQRAEIGCGPVEQTLRMRNGVPVRTYGRTTETVQECFYEAVFSSPEEIPADMPIYIEREDEKLAITAGAFFGGKGETIGDWERMASAGKSYTVIIAGQVTQTTGEIAPDGLSAKRVIPMVDLWPSPQVLGLKTWIKDPTQAN
ncbi:hypothetical protein [Pannonibacter phragmitetus]|uniref:hypothetical protein n=1 Tax=Pannonibacter phragmitetus TaxID=121719 RepID=UPI0013DE27A7|nr:hypothetical protein [Pannonibacter phragmitetus]